MSKLSDREIAIVYNRLAKEFNIPHFISVAEMRSRFIKEADLEVMLPVPDLDVHIPNFVDARDQSWFSQFNTSVIYWVTRGLQPELQPVSEPVETIPTSGPSDLFTGADDKQAKLLKLHHLIIDCLAVLNPDYRSIQPNKNLDTMLNQARVLLNMVTSTRCSQAEEKTFGLPPD